MFELRDLNNKRIAVGKYSELKIFTHVEKLQDFFIIPFV